MVELSQTYADVLNQRPDPNRLNDIQRLRQNISTNNVELSVYDKLSMDVNNESLTYTKEKRRKERQYSTYIPVTIEKTSTGYIKKYYDTYIKYSGKDYYKKDIYLTKEEIYDSKGRLIRMRDYKEADGSIYLRREKEYNPDASTVTTVSQTSQREFLSKNVTPTNLNQTTTQKQIEVTTPEGKKYLIANTQEGKEWATKRFGVDVNQTGMIANDQQGNTYTGRVEKIGGKDVFVGVRPVSEEEQKTRAQLISPSGVAVSSKNNNPFVDLRPPSNYDLPTLSNEILIRPPTKNYTVMPEGTTTRNEFNGFIPFEQVTSELTEAQKPSWTALGADKMLRADIAREKGDLATTSELMAVGAGYQFVGGVKNTAVGAYNDPLGTAVNIGAFTLSTYALGPAGAGLTSTGAVSATFAGATAVEVATGQEPTIVHAVKEPFTFAGESLPYVALGVGYEVTKPTIKAYNAKVSSFFDTRKYAGEIITRDVAGELTLPPGTELSREIQVKPIEQINRVLVEREQGGTSVQVGVNKPVFGEPVFLTAEELANQPKDFVVTADIQQRSTLRQASANPNKLFGDVSSSGVSIGRDFKSSGLVSASDIQGAAQNIVRVEVTPSDLPANLVRESVSQAKAKFEAIELSGETALTVKKTATTKPTPPKALENLPGSLDQWGELANVKGPDGEASLVESFATGEKRVYTKPLVIEKVVNKPSPSKINLNPLTKVKPVTNQQTEVISPSSGLVSVTIPKEPVKILTIKEELAVKKETSLETKKEPLKTNTVVDNRYKITTIDKVTSVNNRPNLQNKLRLFSVSKVGASLSQVSKTSILQGPTSDQTQKPRTDQTTRVGTDLRITQISITQPVSATDTTTRTIQIQTPVSITTPISVPSPRPPQEPEKKPPIFFRSKQSQTGNFKFDVFVRQRGKFKAISRNIGSLEQAFKIGRNRIEKTSAASFRIRTSEGGFVSNSEFLPSTIYTKSKKDNSIFVQKSSQRMSNTEERLNIKRGALWGS